MAIVKLKNISIFGLARQRDEVLRELQSLGCLHLIDIHESKTTNSTDDASRNRVADAVKYLAASPVQNTKQRQRYRQEEGCASITASVLENQNQRETLGQERDYLQKSIESLEPWGDFRLPDAEQIAPLQLWFYVVPNHRRDQFRHSKHSWQLINHDEKHSYVVVISEETPEDIPDSPVTLDPRPLSDLRERLELVEEQLETLHWERIKLTRFTNLLVRDLNEAEDEAARLAAVNKLKQDQSLFALQAWTPAKALPAVKDYCEKMGLAITVADPGREESPPTLLRNPKAVAGAEGAVTFYMTPAYQAWDPTWVMYFSFAFFFAMIMSDAAYGLLLGGVLILAWRRLGGEEGHRRLRTLMLAIVVFCVLYGVAAGSFFGVTPEIFKPYQLTLDGRPLVENHNAMMIISLTIGVLHLTLANLITAWRHRGRSQSLSSLGWAAALSGGLVYGLTREGENRVVAWVASETAMSVESLQPIVNQYAFLATFGGLAAVVLFSSSRPLFSTRISDWLWRLADGVQGLTNVTKAFGDSLSYLRLFALGLASAQLAVTFNDLASGAMEVPGLGLFLALLIWVVGHTINLLLGIMSGLVHGLRLNCIEFFNWSLTEEGYPFQAFRKKAG